MNPVYLIGVAVLSFLIVRAAYAALTATMRRDWEGLGVQSFYLLVAGFAMTVADAIFPNP